MRDEKSILQVFEDMNVIKASIGCYQAELNEFILITASYKNKKCEIYINNLKDEINKKFDKLQSLIKELDTITPAMKQLCDKDRKLIIEYYVKNRKLSIIAQEWKSTEKIMKGRLKKVKAILKRVMKCQNCANAI